MRRAQSGRPRRAPSPRAAGRPCGCRTSPRCGTRCAVSLARDLEEHLVALDHAELVARPLLDRVEALLQVTDLGGERAVPLLERRVLVAPGVHLAVDVPCAQPAALAQPERILDRDDEAGQDAGENFHVRKENTSAPG